MGRRFRSYAGVLMGLAAFAIAASMLGSAYAKDDLLRPLVAEGGPHFPDKPEEWTAWILMISSAITAIVNAVDPAIRKLAKLISDLLGKRQKRHHRENPEHHQAKDRP